MIRLVWVISPNLMDFFQRDVFAGIYSFSNRHSLAVSQIVWKQSEKNPDFHGHCNLWEAQKQNKLDRHDCRCHILIQRLSSDLSVSVGRKVWNVGVICRGQIICQKDTLEPEKQNSRNWFLTKLELSIWVWMLVQCHNYHKKRDLLWSIAALQPNRVDWFCLPSTISRNFFFSINQPISGLIRVSNFYTFSSELSPIIGYACHLLTHTLTD